MAEELPTLRGVALIVGQSDYRALTKLANPKADARAMEARLAELGFMTELALDEGVRKLKRTVSGFIEDAEGADVALVYYSGHAVEVGGVNYLIPVDAGVSSLDGAEESFVPLQQVLDELRRKAKITILLIDACRTNPFPADAVIRKTKGAPGEPISSGGLAATKGVSILTDGSQAPAESLGEVVGYAAEPGQVALDGPAGTNSPYLAALLKHLSANQSYDFGQVMTLVTEEVYLSTQTRQRPWTNASLRRFLTFGGKVEEASPDDARIKDARRSLLLAIAGTPRETRNFVETLANAQKLPLDLVYGMMKELQVDTTGGPEQIEKQLRLGLEQAKRLRAERDVLRQSDLRIIELAKLADRAEAEGALALAKEYWAKASARADELATTRERNKADIMERAREAASVYARHAEAAVLAFDYQTAARELAKAYQEIDWFDARLALKYKLAEADALHDHGYYKGDNDALRQALSLYSLALGWAEGDKNRENWATIQNSRGIALSSLGERESGTDSLREAVVAFEAALTERTRDRMPLYWALTQRNLGTALQKLGEREGDKDSLRRAVAAYEAALTEFTREHAPLDWALTQNNLGAVLKNLGEREGDTEALRKAIATYEAALTEFSRESVPLDWAMTQNNLGNALLSLGKRENDTETLRKAVAAFQTALTERTRERVPLSWANTQNNLGVAFHSLGERESDTESLRKAVAAYEAALTEFSREQVPSDWANAQNNLGNALQSLGARESGTETLRKAVTAFEAALAERTRERNPLDWAMTQNHLGIALQSLGERENGTETLRKAVAVFEAALTEYPHERFPLDWAMTQYNLGSALQSLGERESGTESLRKAAAAFEAALTEYKRESVPLYWAAAQNGLGYSLTLIGEQTNDAMLFLKAVPILRASLKQMEDLRSPYTAYAADSLCRALFGLGAGKKDRALLLEAKTLCLSALDGVAKLQTHMAVKETEANLARIEKALAALD